VTKVFRLIQVGKRNVFQTLVSITQCMTKQFTVPDKNDFGEGVLDLAGVHFCCLTVRHGNRPDFWKGRSPDRRPYTSVAVTPKVVNGWNFLWKVESWREDLNLEIIFIGFQSINLTSCCSRYYKTFFSWFSNFCCFVSVLLHVEKNNWK
jgi:hypothetical protein